MRLSLISAALLGLAACGVDGEPTTPTKDAKPQSGITITGRAEVGITKTW